MANEILQGFQVGLNASLRIQELRSQRAAQAARERAIAQEMALMMEQRNQQIQYRADMAKAFGATKMQTSETVPVFGPTGVIGTVKNPKPMSPEDATFQNIIPVIAKYEPEKVPAALQALATARYRQDSAESLNQQRQSSVKLNEARIKQVEARTKEIQDGKPNTQPEWVESILFLEDRLGRKLAPEVIEDMYKIKQGLAPKAGTRSIPSEGEFVSKHIEKVMEQPVIKEESKVDSFFNREKTQVKYRRPKTLEEGEAVLKEQYQRLFAPEPQAAAPTQEGDELIHVLDPNGKRVKIRQRDLQRALERGFKEFEG